MVCVFINTELDVQNSSAFQKQNGVVVFSEGPNCHKFNLIIGPSIKQNDNENEMNKGRKIIKTTIFFT